MDVRHVNGMAAELYVASRLAATGMTVLWPMMTQSRYDLVVEKDGRFSRVQVKKATWSKSGTYSYLQCRLSKGSKDGGRLYTADEVEYVAATDLNTVWLIPIDQAENRTSLCLLSSNPEYKPYTKYDPTSWVLSTDGVNRYP